MATVEHAIEEHDVVAIREAVDAWPAGTEGTVVSMYDTAALVEVSWTEPPEKIFDYLITVPFEKLELVRSHRTGDVSDVEA